MIPELAPYLLLVTAFVEGRLHASEFELIYLRMFKNDPTHWPAEVFHILNKLFTDADSFCEEESIRGPLDLDGEQLKAAASDAMHRLDALLGPGEKGD